MIRATCECLWILLNAKFCFEIISALCSYTNPPQGSTRLLSGQPCANPNGGAHNEGKIEDEIRLRLPRVPDLGSDTIKNGSHEGW